MKPLMVCLAFKDTSLWACLTLSIHPLLAPLHTAHITSCYLSFKATKILTSSSSMSKNSHLCFIPGVLVSGLTLRSLIQSECTKLDGRIASFPITCFHMCPWCLEGKPMNYRCMLYFWIVCLIPLVYTCFMSVFVWLIPLVYTCFMAVLYYS